MNEHHCLLCMGSNTNRFTQLSDARKVLSEAFPDIHFGELMETQAIGSGFLPTDSILLSAISWQDSPPLCHPSPSTTCSRSWNDTADAFPEIRHKE